MLIMAFCGPSENGKPVESKTSANSRMGAVPSVCVAEMTTTARCTREKARSGYQDPMTFFVMSRFGAAIMSNQNGWGPKVAIENSVLTSSFDPRLMRLDGSKACILVSFLGIAANWNELPHAHNTKNNVKSRPRIFPLYLRLKTLLVFWKMLALLDGGVGHSFKERHGDSDFLGSARACVEAPEKVGEIHRAFFDAEQEYWKGQCFATTSSFAATPAHVQGSELDPLEAAGAATRIATKEACRCGGRHVAGCLPPLARDCYAPSSPPFDFYRDLSEVLLENGADALLAETLCSTAEAMAAIAAANDASRSKGTYKRKNVWVCFTIADDCSNRLRNGEMLVDAIRAIVHSAQGIGVNCCSLDAVDAALPILVEEAASRRREVVVYGNAFQSTTSEWLRSIGRPDCAQLPPSPSSAGDEVLAVCPEEYGRRALRWAQRGATVVGGCCGASPAHMRAVARQLKDAIEIDGRFHLPDPDGVFEEILEATRPLRESDSWLARREFRVTPFCRKLGEFESLAERVGRHQCCEHVDGALPTDEFFTTPSDRPNPVPAMAVHIACKKIDKILEESRCTTRIPPHDAREGVDALSMARHPRLGAKSPAKNLDTLAIKHIFNFAHVPHDRGLAFRIRLTTSHHFYAIGVVTRGGYAVGFEHDNPDILLGR